MTNRRKREKAAKISLTKRFRKMGMSAKAAAEAASKAIRNGRKTS